MKLHHIKQYWNSYSSISFPMFMFFYFFLVFIFVGEKIYGQNIYFWRTQFIFLTLCSVCWNYNLTSDLNFSFSSLSLVFGKHIEVRYPFISNLYWVYWLDRVIQCLNMLFRWWYLHDMNVENVCKKRSYYILLHW